jgi:hypothetical protein
LSSPIESVIVWAMLWKNGTTSICQSVSLRNID